MSFCTAVNMDGPYAVTPRWTLARRKRWVMGGGGASRSSSDCREPGWRTGSGPLARRTPRLFEGCHDIMGPRAQLWL